MISESGLERGLDFPPAEGWHSGIVNSTSKDLEKPRCPGVCQLASCDWGREWVGLESQVDKERVWSSSKKARGSLREGMSW